jgi:hypothetical protein
VAIIPFTIHKTCASLFLFEAGVSVSYLHIPQYYFFHEKSKLNVNVYWLQVWCVFVCDIYAFSY